MDIFSIDEYLRFPIKKYVSSSGFNLIYYANCSAWGEVHADFLIEVIQKTGRTHYQRVHEWCCGHGALGFEILNRKIAQSLCLSDIFLPAIVGCEFTAAVNDVADRVTTYQIESFDNIPPNEKWDLLVADPPHFGTGLLPQGLNQDGIRHCSDPDWNIHKNFYSSVRQYLLDDADIYLIENTDVFDQHKMVFLEMIDGSGLVFCGSYAMPRHNHTILHLKNIQKI